MELIKGMHPQALLRLAAAVLVCLILGGLGGIVTVTGPGSWYSLLVKPAFSPPNWVFAPVWTMLFILMGIALWLVWNEGAMSPVARRALGLFGAQFICNVLWSFLFFGLRSPLLGLADILVLWVLIIATIALFYRVKKTAAYLLVPYLLWVSFASFLNYSIWILNP